MLDSNLRTRRSMLSPEQKALLERRIRGQTANRSVPRIAKRTDLTVAPLSLAQEGIWLQEQIANDRAVYNIFGAIRLRGQLNLQALKASLSEVIRRHDILRTNFRIRDGRPMQFVAEPRALNLEIKDFTHLQGNRQREHVRAWAIQQGSKRFDLVMDELFRIHLLRLRKNVHGILLTVHHIVADGRSLGLLFSEILSHYNVFSNRKPLTLAELPCQYGDYSVWQRENFDERDLNSNLEYWKEKFSGGALLLDLPTDRPRPSVRTLAGDRLPIQISAELAEQIQIYLRQNHISLFTLMFAAYAILLHKHTSAEIILIGSPVSNRSLPELEGMIGLFLDTLVFRADFRGDPSISNFISKAHAEVLETFNYRELTFEKIINSLHIQRERSHHPVFQVALTSQRQRSVPSVPGIQVDHIVGSHGGSRLDLTIYIEEVGNGNISGQLAYATDVFDAATAQNFADSFKCTIESVIKAGDCRISELSVASPRQLHDRLSRRNDVVPKNQFAIFERSEINQSITDRFADQVRRTPEGLAVCDEGISWSYEQLNLRANGIAQFITSRLGRTPGYVALLFDHDAMMIAAMLGVLKSGKTYVPLDPLHPTERLQSIIDIAQIDAVIFGRDWSQLASVLAMHGVDIIDAESIAPTQCGPEVKRYGESEAYVLFTSGTTGMPKGVVQNDRNVLHFISVYVNALHLDVGDRLSLFSSYGFDASVMDIYGALLSGASLHLRSFRHASFRDLGEWIRSHAITVWHSTPTVFRHAVLDVSVDDCVSVRVIVLGGEETVAADLSLLHGYFPRGCLLVNGYGPTESTVALQYFASFESEISGIRLPLGYPVEDTQILLLDRHGAPCDLRGEIAIASPFVALGYLKQPALTAERFVPSPFGKGGRAYRTGDLGRWRTDGTIEYLGRIDHQVKLRGYRVELGEIEAALCTHASVSRALVVVCDAPSRDKRLIAYVIPVNRELDQRILRNHLQRCVPAYMVPSAFVMMESFPVTTNGKIDRHRLPAAEDQAEIDNYVAPRTPLEELLVAIWRKNLSRDDVGIESNFFDVGGHSLLLQAVCSEICSAIHQEIPITALFQYPTIRTFAEYLEGERRSQEARSSGRKRADTRKRSPTSLRVHRSNSNGQKEGE